MLKSLVTLKKRNEDFPSSQIWYTINRPNSQIWKIANGLQILLSSCVELKELFKDFRGT